ARGFSMALKLTCPNCGSRPHTEFWFGGEVESGLGHPPATSAGSATPRPPLVVSIPARAAELEADFARVWWRRNSHGTQHERWFHHAGCRRWHTAVRDTLTNEVHVRR
ncbi:MAG: sarcosine oxidase subunit delta, partial [Thermoanaerobaculia bacterium]